MKHTGRRFSNHFDKKQAWLWRLPHEFLGYGMCSRNYKCLRDFEDRGQI